MITPIQHAKQQKQHTKGRLVVEKMHGGDWSIGNDSYVATCDSGSENNKANAERLAHCWNCHDQLVEACENAAAELELMRAVVGTVSRSRWECAGEVLKSLRETILAATGKDEA